MITGKTERQLETPEKTKLKLFRKGKVLLHSANTNIYIIIKMWIFHIFLKYYTQTINHSPAHLDSFHSFTISNNAEISSLVCTWFHKWERLSVAIFSGSMQIWNLDSIKLSSLEDCTIYTSFRMHECFSTFSHIKYYQTFWPLPIYYVKDTKHEVYSLNTFVNAQ